MVTRVLLDTSYLIAWHRATDELHPRAELVKETLEEVKPIRYILDCVYSELIAVHARVCKDEEDPEELVRIIEEFRKTYGPHIVEMAYVGGRQLLERVVRVCGESAKKYGVCISPHDAMLLLYAREKGIKYVISFDEDLAEVKTLEEKRSRITVINDENRELLGGQA